MGKSLKFKLRIHWLGFEGSIWKLNWILPFGQNLINQGTWCLIKLIMKIIREKHNTGCYTYRLNMTCVESVISLAPNPGWPAKEWADRPHLGSVGPGLFATSSPHVILSETTPGFGHNEDMHGFWSIWCFSVIRCSWNGRSTKLMELVSNRHLSSISWMKYRCVGGKYMHFMTTNSDLAMARCRY